MKPDLQSLREKNCPIVQASFDGNVLKVEIPAGICLKEGPCGYGLYATKLFKTGDALFLNRHEVIDDIEKEFTLIANNAIYKLNTVTHTCIIANNKRALYNFDAMFNHSCNPNTLSYSTKEMAENSQYLTVALRDINIGDEITCNYNLFEYDCFDKGIDVCNCNEINCHKKIWGFKWLNFEEQIKLLTQFQIDRFIIDKFLADFSDRVPFEIRQKFAT